jgi:hypothetical protein
MVSGFPLLIEAKDDDYDEDILQFLTKNAIPGKTTKIIRVNLAYDITELEELQEKKNDILKNK